jgi:hypothetical protein
MRALLLLGLAACHVAIGTDVRSHTSGPLAKLATPQPIARAPLAGDAAAPEDTGANYSLALGIGTKDFRIAAALHTRDASSSTLTIPLDGMRHYNNASAALDFQWSFLRLKHFATTIHAGPARTLLVDRGTGEHEWGFGARYGAGLELTWGYASVFADAYRESIVFDAGPAQGTSTVSGVMVGVAVHGR